MKRILFPSLAIILTLSLIFTTAPFKPARAATIWYVNPGESIQAAIDNANDYDTIIVNPGIYKEWLTIEKQLTLQGLDKDTTILYGSVLTTKPAIEIKNTSDVNISNLTISGNVTIGSLKTGGYGRGVRLENADNCTVVNNRFLDIKGISLTDYCGLETSSADNNVFTDNTFENNEFGIILRNGSTGNRIENNIILGNGIGMKINHSSDNWLENNSISNSNSHGIYLEYSANGTTITGNSIFNNASGIYLDILCNQNTITDNSIYDHGFNGVSILTDSDENNIDKNNIYNNKRGVLIYSSANNTISGNIIRDNDMDGIYLGNATTDTIIYHNSIENNSYGIYNYNAHFTTVYNNNFIDNSPQAHVYSGASPVFNLDPPIGGNYWNNWTTPDVDPVDGFVDNPYVFGQGHDDWPWAEPDGWLQNQPPDEITVQIDIKPGSDPNSINLNSKGVIPVAILTEGSFDAASVNATTVCFGKDEAEPVHYSLEDVDDDGDTDMIFHFRTQDTGLEAGDTEATLTGQTTDGIEITGTDSVRIVPPEVPLEGNSKPGKGKGRGNGGGNPNPGQGNNQGGGGDKPNSGQGNGQDNQNGNSNPGQGNGPGNQNGDPDLG